MNSKRQTNYEKALQELKRECGILMSKYAVELHNACHDDNGDVTLSHLQIVRKIQEDCISICTDSAQKITFRGEGEKDCIPEILEFNYDEADIQHIIEKEDTSLFSLLQMLKEKCIKRSDPEWAVFGIPELLQSGKFDPGPRGSMRTQFCKCCGDPIYLKWH